MVFTRSFAAHKLLYLCMDKVSQAGPTSTKSGSCELESRYTRLLVEYSGLQTLCPWPEGILVIQTLTQKAGTTTRCTLASYPLKKSFGWTALGTATIILDHWTKTNISAQPPFGKGAGPRLHSFYAAAECVIENIRK